MMRIFKKLLLLELLLFFHYSLSGQVISSDVEKALKIVKNNSVKLDTINQLLVVFSDNNEGHSVVLVAMEKKGSTWHNKFDPMIAGIGRNGFAAPGDKYEGDGKTPSGIYRLGMLFCYEQTIKTQLAYTTTSHEDKWIDDPESDDYNKHIRGNTEALSYENLLLNSDTYKYCMVIEYNTLPVIKGRGSAIFFHLCKKPPCPTAGCVAIKEADMELIVSWLQPNKKPSIIMGDTDLLISGF
jgi:L,D-peptidoglycan transpeptidase YkuD (ErfK/YbiS/YcfS/YnhG family)